MVETGAAVERLRAATGTVSGGRPHEGSVTFIGTATVLLHYAGFTILTDPNFLHRGEQVAIGYGLRSTRLTDPAMELDALPPLDLIVLSHLHEDHFDKEVQQRLNKRIPIVTTPQSAVVLRQKGFHEPRPLPTWRSRVFTKGGMELRISAMPGRHAPGPLAALLPSVMGSMLEFGPAGAAPTLRLYITGDTLLADDLKEIPRRYPEIDLALLHLGGTRVLGLMVTMDAAQGLRLMRIVRPRMTIPIHYNDYTVFKEPLEPFATAVAEAGLEDQVHYLRHGETYTFEA